MEAIFHYSNSHSSLLQIYWAHWSLPPDILSSVGRYCWICFVILMDKSSFIKRKKKSKKSYSSSSSSEDDKYKTKSRLKENEQEVSERKWTHKTEPDRGECSDSKIKKSGKLKTMKRRHSESSSSTSESEHDKKKRKKHKKKRKDTQEKKG